MVPTEALKTIIGVITGPTATGKTALALEFAGQHNGRIEIINADSLLVYRGMDIGTAKPTPAERSQVRHHLIDIRDPDERYTAGDFIRDATTAAQEIAARGNRALVVGGTGFYIKALCKGMWQAPKSDPAIRAELESRPLTDLYSELTTKDPLSPAQIGPNDRYRVIRALELVALTGRELAGLRRPTQPQALRGFACVFW